MTRRRADRCRWCGGSRPELPVEERARPRADRSREVEPPERAARAAPPDGHRVDRDRAGIRGRRVELRPREDRRRLAVRLSAKPPRDVAEPLGELRWRADPLPNTGPQLSARSGARESQVQRRQVVRHRPSCDWRARPVASAVLRPAPVERQRVAPRRAAPQQVAPPLEPPPLEPLGARVFPGSGSRLVRRPRWFVIQSRPRAQAGAPAQVQEREEAPRGYPADHRARDSVPCGEYRRGDPPETTCRTSDSASSGRSTGHAARPPDREPCSPDIRP